MRSLRLLTLPLVLAFTLTLALAGHAAAQGTGVPVFSVDWRSISVSSIDSFTLTPITEGDLLAPAFLTPTLGAQPTPGIVESGGTFAPVGLALPLHAPCVGHPGGTPCAVEVDALSHALDPLVQCSGVPNVPPPTWVFSVSFRGLGFPGSPAAPNVVSEGPCADEGADVYHSISMPCGPMIPTLPFGHSGFIDGDGFASCSGAVYPGLGLIEPGPATDNLDGLDLDVPDQWLPRTTCTYFSLDSAFFDPGSGTFNSGSAAAHGFVGGDVLMSCPGCPPAVYASAAQLGLDLGGVDTDDLDALVLRENGTAGYQRSTANYDWITAGKDMLFFSVRRGSAIVGQPDGLFGIPIEPGDILFPTGILGTRPGIWIAAESLGLATPRMVPGVVIGDDIDALDVAHDPWPGTGFCFGDGSGTPCPCANFGAPGRGCGNSANALGGHLWANGFASISNDTVHFTVSGLPSTVFTILVQGTAALNGGLGLPFSDGLRCVGGSVKRLYRRNALCGNREYGFTVPGDSQVSVAGGVSTPQTLNYQVWYRNPVNYCTPGTLNFTNAYRIVWTP